MLAQWAFAKTPGTHAALSLTIMHGKVSLEILAFGGSLRGTPLFGCRPFGCQVSIFHSKIWGSKKLIFLKFFKIQIFLLSYNLSNTTI